MLLERDEELAAIEAALDAAVEGNGSLLIAEGTAGIGKTELLRWTHARALDQGIDALGARGGELEKSLAFGIVRQLFEERLAGASAGEREELWAGAASLAGPALGREPVADAQPAASPFGDPADAIHHGLYWLCVNLAERTPLVLAVDDLHWADPASVRWLVYLARRLEGLRVLVIAATRPGEAGVDPHLIASLASEPCTQVLHPAELSERATATLVRNRLGEDADAAFCSACHAASGGNPFLLGELLEAVRRDGIAPTARSTAMIEALAPETVSRSTLLRIARLMPGAAPLARAVAILGRRAEPRHAAELAGLGEEEAAEAADALAGASILAAGRPLRFAHPLLRSAVYEQIPEGERALEHARAARMLAGEGAPPEEIATHLLPAEVTREEWVVAILADAAAAATGRGAPDAAIAYLRRALEHPASVGRRVELLLQLLDAGVIAGQPAILEEISGDPIGELTATPELLRASARPLSMWLLAARRFDEAAELGERVIAGAKGAGRSDLALKFELQRLSVIPTSSQEALTRLRRYADVIEPGSGEERLLLAQLAWWETYSGSGTADRCASLAQRALADRRIFREQADTAPLTQVILVLICADELDQANRWIDHGTADAQRRGSRFGFTGMVAARSHLAYRRGDVAGAIEHARTAVEASTEYGNLVSIPVHAAWLTDALVERGEFGEAEADLAKIGLSGELPDHHWFLPLRFSRAYLRFAAGRIEEALEEARTLARIASNSVPGPAVYPHYALMATALNMLGREPEEQQRLSELELERARRWGTARVIGVALRAKAQIEGGERGIELLRESAEVLRGSPARLEYARALTDLGASLRRTRRRREAREPLTEALDVATRCGASLIAERAREELAATGARPRRLVLTGVESLTPSEARIARMAADGMTNKEIAQGLFVTVKTVEMHLGHAYAKLEISSRKELPKALAAGG